MSLHLDEIRLKIVDLAIRGKLVPQDENDVPAAELLKKIREEKEHLVVEGKIKKSKPLPSITEDEMPFELPRGWEWVRLGTLTKIKTGKLDVNASSEDGIYPFFTCAKEPFKIASYSYECECVLVAGNGDLNVKYYNGKFDAYQRTYIIEPLDNQALFVPYLFCFLNKYIKILREQSVGGVIKYIKINDLTGAPIPLPPLNEQKRIVKKIDQLMVFYSELLSSTTNISTTISDIKNRALQLAIQGKLVKQSPDDEPAGILLEKIQKEKEQLIKEGKIKKGKPLPPITEDEIPFELPKGWEWVRLGELGETQTGMTPSKNQPKYFGKEYSFIKPGDIFDNFINYNNEGLTEAGIKNGRYVRASSILMVCIGTIGKANITERDCSCNQQINALTTFSEINPQLLLYFMRTIYFQNELKKRAGKTTLPILSKKKWELVPIPLPPLAEQKRIVEKVDQLMSFCDEMEKNIKQSENHSKMLMESVLQKAMKVPSENCSPPN